MDWSDSPEQALFRTSVCEFLDARLPRHYQRGEADAAADPDWQVDHAQGNSESREAAQAWLRALSGRGWVAPHWPTHFGGAGLSTIEQFVLRQEIARRGAPVVNSFGVNMFGPTVIAHGSPEQQQGLLPRIVSGASVWAQGYSEPAAGSDLASLQLSAVRHGDHYVVNGQKIWTTGAHTADGIYFLARTDPEAPKHRGISLLYLTELRQTPGISIRPLVNMADRHEFNEVFFEDVSVPVGQRIGDENNGWYVAMTLLDNERSNISDAMTAQRNLRTLLAAVGQLSGRPRLTVRLEIADRWVESAVMANFSFLVASKQHAGEVHSVESSISRLFGTELRQRVARTGMRALGMRAAVGAAPDSAEMRFADLYLSTVSATIGGGTAEVQRNIIATRGLGLPRG